MEIPEIKTRLTLSEVLRHYSLKPDKNQRLNCPFHEDKTPSLQVYYKTHTAYCFSSNCQTHGKSMDVIDFVMYMEKSSKHEAIEKCKALLGDTPPAPVERLTKSAILTKMFIYFKNAVHNSKPARDYLEQRGLDFTKVEIGYNTGQFHHGARKEEALLKSCVEVGLLSDLERPGRTGETCYKPFAKYCIVFALRNPAGQVSGLYFRSTLNEGEARHFYLKESEGLYPHYPSVETGRLILTEAIIDAATLLQMPAVISRCSILSAYGTNRLNAEHIRAIEGLGQLQEIIFAFDNDEAGNQAAMKYAVDFKKRWPRLHISRLNLPPNEDVNSMAVAHTAEIFTHLLETRSAIFFSTESTEKESVEPPGRSETLKTPPCELDSSNPQKLSYQTPTARYSIQGGLGKTADSLRVTLVVEEPESHRKSRSKLDLYEDKQIEKTAKEVAEKLQLRKDLLEADLYRLTDLLDAFREKEWTEKNTEEREIMEPLTAPEVRQIEQFLKRPQLLKNLNDLLGRGGLVGEENNRIFLLLIAISYKMPETLHALIQGSSGSGKTRLLKQISDCIPPEKVTRLTRLSDKVLYNYPEKYFINRLLCLEDIDGLSEEAEFAFRELQSNGELRSAASVKQDNGQMTAGQKIVKGPIASMACTTKGEIYEDNMSRVFLLAVDESAEQTQRIIAWQNARAAGQTDALREQEIKRFLQHLIRLLQPCEVLNLYANQLHLPREAHKIRRLNDLFLSFVKMVTVVHQYQRRKDERGRLQTEIEDIESAVEIMLESIVLKVDELDGSIRQFFEKLKSCVAKKSKAYEFTRFEVRAATGVGKTQQHHYLNRLLELEYLQQFGYANRGFRYKIVHWDDYTALRERIKQHLSQQIEQLKIKATVPQSEHQRTPDRTPAQGVRSTETA